MSSTPTAVVVRDREHLQPVVPIWVPDAADPTEGSWQFVDPHAPHLEPRIAAQAAAVAELWQAA